MFQPIAAAVVATMLVQSMSKPVVGGAVVQWVVEHQQSLVSDMRGLMPESDRLYRA